MENCSSRKGIGVLTALLFLMLCQNAYTHNYVKIYQKKITDYQVDFYADNTNLCPYQFVLNIDWDSNRQDVSTNLPFYSVIKPHEKDKFLFSLVSLDKLPAEVKCRSEVTIGDPENSFENTNQIYIFPFEEGIERRVNQGYNTRYSHNGWLKYSVDFGMDIGTPVCATRDGIVVDLNVSSSKGGRRRYRSMANYITLYHSDGTYSQYVHLKKNGTNVVVGDIVKAGQIIGYSGNTGWTTGPHLHFMAYKPTYMGRETFPTKFLGYNGELVGIEPKKYYLAYHHLNETNSFYLLTNLVRLYDTNISEETNLGGL